MRIRKKTLIMLVCTLVVLSSVAFGTIAYLTDRTAVTNRFTIGNVDITVNETKVDEDGNPIYPEGTELNPDGTPVDPNVKPERTEEENEYPLVPGSEYTKDPTMTVKAGSKQSYVRMLVTVSNAKELDAIFAELQTQYPEKYANGFLPQEHVTEWDSAKWNCAAMTKDETLNTYTLEFRYFEAVEPTATEDTTLAPLFKTIRIPGELTNAHLATLENFTIEVDGNAIQATGFESADEAWTAFDAQTIATSAAPEQP